MSQDNFVQIIGRLTRDPQLRYSQGGIAIASFGLAWAPRRKNKDTGEWEDGETSFFNCTAWRQLGENVAASLVKGDRVMVTGSISIRPWEDKDGKTRTSVEIDVEDCGPMLKWSQASVERAERSTSTGGGGSTGGRANLYPDDEPFVTPAGERDL